ncbi:MAG TPA: penicillin-binding transpeptidase domain-containing protein, partial [Allosphingosinicella sp.]|nr:penicillin-binding transpeptidase domain-containing protein [Allosphingosinicella sp.]
SMVLGPSAVRLVEMPRAFAAVARKGAAVVPYGIRRVTTSSGELLYEHEVDESRVLVAPWVAAQMTDLLQSAVLTGTGRAAQIGRPVAGKTGTTSSNKDGWFIGFSSGLTTGVWMGRDDARPIPGLQGGRAPAQAFRDFMVPAVARRPVEAFDVQVTLPDWELEPDEEAWFGDPEQGMMVDADGNPVEAQPGIDPADPNAIPEPQVGAPPPGPGAAGEERLDQDWLDRAVRRDRPPPPPREMPPRGREESATLPEQPPSDEPDSMQRGAV